MLKGILLLIFTSVALAVPEDPSQKVKYRTNFGPCPSRAAGGLVLDLVKSFEKKKSLIALKREIVDGELDKKHFLSQYTVSYDPLRKLLNFSFNCPTPLMKVQIYREDAAGPYEAILVDTAKLYDPIYETLLRSEDKLEHDLPHLAIPVGEMDEKAQLKITDLVLFTGEHFRRKISEVILAESGDLTIIMSILGRPSSVFIGHDEWNKKVTKLKRLVKYVEEKRKVPAIINLVNAEKVVVKFNDQL